MSRNRIYSQVRRRVRKMWRRSGIRPRHQLYFVGILALVLTLGGLQQLASQNHIHPRAYTPLLDIIAEGESTGNYNAYFGNASNRKIRFTEMTIDEVMKWQSDYVAGGSVSNAVGRYQIIQPTLEGLVEQLDIDTNQLFDEPMQDKMAIALLERRGSLDYAKKEMSREQFAASLAKEWAALPRVTGAQPDQSYYQADGINKARVSVKEIYAAIDQFDSLA